jgi:hypothetical protein
MCTNAVTAAINATPAVTSIIAMAVLLKPCPSRSSAVEIPMAKNARIINFAHRV